MNEIIKDKNDKISSKRIIAIACFFVSLFLTYLKVFHNLGDNYLIALFLGEVGIQGFACTCEKDNKIIEK